MLTSRVLICTAPGIGSEQTAALRAHLTESLENADYQIVVNYECSVGWFDRTDLCRGLIQFHGMTEPESKLLAEQIRNDAVVVVPCEWSRSPLRWGGR